MEKVFITDVKIVSASRDYIDTYKCQDVHLYESRALDDYIKDLEIKTERVHSLQFRQRDGRLIAIGATKDVQDILKIPFEAFDNMARQISYQRGRIDRLMKSVDDLQFKLGWEQERYERLMQSKTMRLRRWALDYLEML